MEPPPTRVPRLRLQMRPSRTELAARLERRRVCKVAGELERERRGWAEWGCAREKPASCELSGEEGGKGSEFRFLNGGWVERAGAAGGPAGHTRSGAEARAARPAMAGERTRRFTRSLLRPGQAAELRHSAASAAAVAVSSRQQQRVSVVCPSRHWRGLPGDPQAGLAASPVSPCTGASLSSTSSLAPQQSDTSARQCHQRIKDQRRIGDYRKRGTLR